MYLGKTQLIFIVGLLGVYIISSVAHGMVERAAATLDRDVRERVWQRLTLGLWWWRIADMTGVALMVAGVLRVVGLLPAIGGVAWGIPALAIGLALVSIASSIRAWIECLAYRHETPDTPASHSARNAAIVVTAAELCLAGIVCWYVFNHIAGSTSSSRSGSTTPAARQSTGKAETETPVSESLWVDQAEALQLLKGKGAVYLDALARRKDIRSKVEDGRTLYHRGDIVAMKRAGLPSMEEMQEDLKAK